MGVDKQGAVTSNHAYKSSVLCACDTKGVYSFPRDRNHSVHVNASQRYVRITIFIMCLSHIVLWLKIETAKQSKKFHNSHPVRQLFVLVLWARTRLGCEV